MTYAIAPPIPAAVATRRRQRRDELLSAASAVFIDRGYHAAAVDEIAHRAGVSKPILYQYFPSKRELYLAVLDHHAGVLVTSVRAALLSTDDNKSRVRAAVRAFYDFVDNDVQGFRLVFESDLASDIAVAARIEQVTEDCLEAVNDLVEHDSGLDHHRARVLAAGLIGASRLAARYWLDTDRPISKAAAIETTVALAWGGLSRVPPSVDTAGHASSTAPWPRRASHNASWKSVDKVFR